MHRLPALVTLLAALALPAAAQAYVPTDADWQETYISTPDGHKLHADVLRPKGATDADKTPVIMTVSPYTNHSGQQGPLDFNPDAQGPSSRFRDFEDGADPFAKGYTYVIVDLPGFGGSSGCTDWGGPEEQGAVKDAVEWAAAQPWSTGKVGTYGKSYDAWTGLMAIAKQPKGLAAVVSQEPVYSGYTYEYMNGVRTSGTWNFEGPLFDVINATPGTTSDTPDYQANSAPINPACLATNAALQQNDDPEAGFWKVRNLVGAVKGLTTPLFMTQGFLEDNTKPEGAWDLFNNLAGPKRGWFGQWDHVRGNDKVGSKLAMGREGWFDEVMRFYDTHLKGVTPAVQDPPVVVESGDGKWRSEQQWPPAGSRSLWTPLRAGSYADDNGNNGTGSGAGKGIWTISAPLSAPLHFAGVPQVTVDTQTTLPNANLVADVYDIDGAGKATLISRGAQLLRSGGLVSFDLYGNDWPIAAGHRIGVLLSSSNAEWWDHVPTQQTVTVTQARISLPFLTKLPTYDQTGTPSVKLAAYKSSAPFQVDQATIDGSTAPFTLPPAGKAARKH